MRSTGDHLTSIHLLTVLGVLAQVAKGGGSGDLTKVHVPQDPAKENKEELKIWMKYEKVSDSFFNHALLHV